MLSELAFKFSGIGFFDAYSTQMLVTNGTTLMYQQIEQRTRRKPGKLNMLSKTNDNYKSVGAWETRAFCIE